MLYIISRHSEDSLQKFSVVFSQLPAEMSSIIRCPANKHTHTGKVEEKPISCLRVKGGQHSSPESTAQKQKEAGAAGGSWHRLYRDIRSHQEVLD